MEDIKMLVEMIAGLPTLAVWVLAGFLAYKLAIIGSVYGLIRFAVDKTHDFLITRKKLPTVEQEFRMVDRLKGITISTDETLNMLIMQMQRLRGKNVNIDSPYIHEQSVLWLAKAIDEAEKRDLEKQAAKEEEKRKRESERLANTMATADRGL